jgi:uncharacterized membrane protein HdeD (DUF308 family)
MQTHLDHDAPAANWRWVLARGVLGLTFGALVLFVPALTVRLFAALFGAFALLEGAANLVVALRVPGHARRWGALALEGATSVVAGLGASLLAPQASAALLLWIVAAWLVVTGAFQVAAAARLRRAIAGEGRLALTAVLSLLTGIAMVVVPGAAAAVLALWFGAYAVLFGVLLAGVAFSLRGGLDWPAPGALPHAR